MTPTSTAMLIAVPLIVWRMYSRIRRLVGRQPLRPWRSRIAMVVFPLLALAAGLGALRHPPSLAALAAGLAGGALLAVLALRLTSFEDTASGYFYTPNAHIGIGLSLLFVARIGYRLFEIFQTGGAAGPGAMQDFGASPLTLSVFGMMAGYFSAYAAGLLRWRRRQSLQNAVCRTP